MSVPMFILSKESSAVNAVVAPDIDVLEFLATETAKIHNVNIAKLSS